MMEINWLAVLAATLSMFVLGALWYGPIFGKAWMKEHGFTMEELKNANMGKIYGVAFVLQLIMAINLAFFLNGLSIQEGIGYGFATGFGWISMAIGVNYLFSRSTFKLWFIDGIYFAVALTIMGLILTAWP